MSTKAIMEALTVAKSIGAPTSSLSRLCAEALREVAAIRQAAKDVTNGDTEEADPAVHEPAMQRYMKGVDLLVAIAAESE